MPSTNKTANYNLSQFSGTDKAKWKSDYNADMLAIDNAIKGVHDGAVPQNRTIANLDLTKDRTLAELTAAGLGANNKNQLINGDYRINQRNVELSTATAYSTVDRWRNDCSSGVTCQVSRYGMTTELGEALDGNYAMNLKPTAVSTAGFENFVQQLESDPNGISPLSGKTVTFSINAYCDSDYRAIGIGYSTGGNDIWPSNVNIPSNTNGRYSCTVKIPYGATRVLVGVVTNRSLTSADVNTQIAIWNAKLEIGSVPTPFESRPYAQELAMCQRFFVSTDSAFAHPVLSAGRITGERFPVQMRSAHPTVTLLGYDGTTNELNKVQKIGTTEVYGATPHTNSDNICWLDCSDAVLGQPGYHYGYIADAEIY